MEANFTLCAVLIVGAPADPSSRGDDKLRERAFSFCCVQGGSNWIWLLGLPAGIQRWGDVWVHNFFLVLSIPFPITGCLSCVLPTIS